MRQHAPSIFVGDAIRKFPDFLRKYDDDAQRIRKVAESVGRCCRILPGTAKSPFSGEAVRVSDVPVMFSVLQGVPTKTWVLCRLGDELRPPDALWT